MSLRVILVLALSSGGLVGCGDSGDSGDVFTVTMNWKHFETEGGYCSQEPIVCPSSGCGAACEQQGCTVGAITLECCVATLQIEESDLPTLITDYQRCTVTQNTSVSYSIECDLGDNPPLYEVDIGGFLVGTSIGEEFEYTSDTFCDWDPPYAI